MERLLMVCIDDQTSRHVPLNQAIIRSKAPNLFSDIKAKDGEAVNDAEFRASCGWLGRFK
jgi:hypothetical protein